MINLKQECYNTDAVKYDCCIYEKHGQYSIGNWSQKSLWSDFAWASKQFRAVYLSPKGLTLNPFKIVLGDLVTH